MKEVSVVVPTLNEEANVSELVRRFDDTFKSAGVVYEIIFIDDHSSDNTRNIIRELSKQYPVFLFLKQGIPGKSYSLLEGFRHARYAHIAMIDADLQYSPEEVLPMLSKLATGLDIVVANRITHETSFTRKIFSRGFSLLFSRWLHNLHCDVQSGLKVFKRQIVQEVNLRPTPWTFDLEFLLQARNYGYHIGTHDIVFSERKGGESKIILRKVIWEIGMGAVKLKFKKHHPLALAPRDERAMTGAGMAHKRKRFITHTTIHHHFSALDTFSHWQKITLISLVVLLALGFFFRPMGTAITLVGILSAIYFLDVFFNVFLVVRSLRRPPEVKFSSEELARVDSSMLPVYSILCPLYKEANMLPTFVEGISRLDWPKEKLDVMLLLEENDLETIDAAKSMKLPDYIHILVVPHSMPKTKPKACNYGLCHARGEFVVIYDAEDKPEPLQLKKAWLGFQKLPSSVRCLQAKLNYFNPHQNFLTRLFTAEYSLWFDLALPGLQSIETSIPLGGTSNHFRTNDLLELEGWDPFNVTEDCDLGVRIFTRGYRTAIIDSVTLEEANSKLGNWIRQRSRWIKGYMQTYLVHMRNPWKFFRKNGFHMLLFQLTVGGKMAFIFINPLLWIATISYFAFYTVVGPTIEALYPPVIFYMAVISLLFGNFLAIYYYMLGCIKRNHWSLVKYVFLIPLYWVMVSIAGFIALYQLFIKPHYWEKTRHGLHLDTSKTKLCLIQTYWSRCRNILCLHLLQTVIRKKIHRAKISNFLRTLLKNEGSLVAAMMISNVLNFAFNAFLGRKLSYEDFGLITLVNTLWYVTTIFTGSFSTAVTHRIAYSYAEKSSSGWKFLNTITKKGLKTVLALSLAWIFLIPALSDFFKISDYLVLIIFTLAFPFGFIVSANRGYLQGTFRFRYLAVLYMIENSVKFLLAILFVSAEKPSWTHAAIPFSIVTVSVASIISVWIAANKVQKNEPAEAEKFKFPFQFFTASIMTSLSSLTFLSFDVILVKHYFSPLQAGEYSLLSLAGKMIYFLGMLPVMFMVTYVSRNEGMKRDSRQTLLTIFSFTLFAVIAGELILGYFGYISAPLLFGSKAFSIIPYLPGYTLAIALFTLSSVLVTYHLALRHYFFSYVSLFASCGMAIGIILFHSSLKSITGVMFVSSFVNLTAITLMHIFEKQFGMVRSNFKDLLGIFSGSLPGIENKKVAGKRILIFNWRDVRHTYAGGAEIYIHELAKLWIKQNNKVTIFCGNDSLSPRGEVIDGVEIIRRGGFYFVYIWAFLYYMIRFRGNYDIIIDCQNGVPFFTPLYAREPVYCLMHHVHQEVFFRHLAKPLAVFASWLEKSLMPLVYRNTTFITVSRSSRDEMEALGLGKAGIHIVHPGVHLHEFTAGARSVRPTVLYLGRLKAYKSVDILLRAFFQTLQSQPDAQLIIAGTGDAEEYLKDLADALRLTGDQVVFMGKVTNKEKIRLLQKAWVLVNPSFMEGWGIVVIEANACGTPVIASDVPGLRDSVKESHSGYLVPYGDIDEFTKKILRIIKDGRLRDEMNTAAREWAENFDWEKSSQNFFMLLTEDK